MATTQSWLYARRRPWHGCAAHPSLGDEPEFLAPLQHYPAY